MEGTEGEFQDEARKLQIAIRCAKAAFLLSSLKSSVNRVNDEPEEEKIIREIENLRVAFVKERLKINKIKLRGLTELILQVVFGILISCFFTKQAFDTFHY
ncbi:hypothetical protein ERO13_A05G267250v2 [Gossypium hirsutum]|uniref:Uncharacterized protein n=2 Tax=Gossypium TaxID=3633 RepID=A0A2P5VY91_GOSBA|nr:hypothetical protein ES319_A05G278700v1 [Gossypium barbadense]KAG4201252.1 hypothetical protein ERO13_A05G267250v2 [Gossypium hirsutum]PPR83818.1 hypothetical protein GOBAR_AA36897 [Gossypium barbadense]TYJ36110.1 hypothetical protein E1A91_A05G285500v1 [Gossypium mustelinum]